MMTLLDGSQPFDVGIMQRLKENSNRMLPHVIPPGRNLFFSISAFMLLDTRNQKINENLFLVFY